MEHDGVERAVVDVAVVLQAQVGLRSASPARARRSRAKASCSVDSVTPVTWAPNSVAAISASAPQPQPISSTRSPGCTPAMRQRAAHLGLLRLRACRPRQVALEPGAPSSSSSRPARAGRTRCPGRSGRGCSCGCRARVAVAAGAARGTAARPTSCRRSRLRPRSRLAMKHAAAGPPGRAWSSRRRCSFRQSRCRPTCSAAPQTFQLCSVMAAWGAAPLPKRWRAPSGSCRSSVPWRSCASRCRTARAAAGAPCGQRRGGGGGGVHGCGRASTGDESLRGCGLAEEGHALEPQPQRLPVDARHHAQRHQRVCRRRRARSAGRGRRVRSAPLTLVCSSGAVGVVVVDAGHAALVPSRVRMKRKR